MFPVRPTTWTLSTPSHRTSVLHPLTLFVYLTLLSTSSKAPPSSPSPNLPPPPVPHGTYRGITSLRWAKTGRYRRRRKLGAFSEAEAGRGGVERRGLAGRGGGDGVGEGLRGEVLECKIRLLVAS